MAGRSLKCGACKNSFYWHITGCQEKKGEKRFDFKNKGRCQSRLCGLYRRFFCTFI